MRARLALQLVFLAGVRSCKQSRLQSYARENETFCSAAYNFRDGAELQMVPNVPLARTGSTDCKDEVPYSEVDDS